MGMPRALSAALLAGLAALIWPSLRSLATEERAPFVMAYVDQGESLRHGVYPSEDYMISARMPVEPLLESFLLIHCGPAAARAAVAFAAVVSLALLWALAALVSGAWAGALAVFLGHAWWVPGWTPGVDFHKSFFFTLYVLLAAAALARRARAPSSWNTDLLLSAAIGASLLVRSTLAFLPPVLAFSNRKRFSKRTAVILLLPYLFLAPWIRMNWIRYHAFIPFENRTAQANIVTGALGIVRTAESDASVLMDAPADDAGSALGWAAKQVIRHPWRYLLGFLGRLLFAARLYPLLLAAALLSLWIHRDREDFRQLALFCGYFILIHCFMSVEASYFLPLKPILAALAATLLFVPFESPDKKPGSRAAGGLVAACALLALGTSLAAWRAVDAHAAALSSGPISPTPSLEKALSAQPQDAWLLYQKGEAALRAGDPDAAKYLLSALSLRPQLPRARLDAAWAMALGGEPQTLLGLALTPDWRSEDSVALRLYQTLICLRLKRPQEAAAHFAAARSAWRGNQAERAARPIQAGPDRAGDKKFADNALRLPLAEPDRRALAALAAQAEPAQAALWNPAPAVPKTPERPEAWLDAAQAALKDGRRAEALAALSRAQALGPSVESLPREAALWAKIKELPRALAAAASLVGLSPKDPDAWLLQAEIALQAGRPELAAASLDRARSLSPDAPRRRRIALLYQQNGAYAPALEMLAALAQAAPGEAGLQNDLGVCQYGAGRLADSEKSFREAIRLDPGLLEAYLSLGAVLEGQGRGGQARALYDQALARPPRKEDEAVRRLIVTARNENP